MKWLLVIGIVIGLLPILLAAIVSLKNKVSLFNEGTGGGAFLFFFPFTFVIGLILCVLSYFLQNG